MPRYFKKALKSNGQMVDKKILSNCSPVQPELVVKYQKRDYLHIKIQVGKYCVQPLLIIARLYCCFFVNI